MKQAQRRMGSLHPAWLLLCLVAWSTIGGLVLASASASAPAPASAMLQEQSVTPSRDNSGGGNVVVQLGKYVKDSVTRAVDGSKEMWYNHKRCNDIRSKQKDYREQVKAKYEMTEKDLSPKVLRQRLKNVNGGITYDEFMFLQQGKDDRGKVMNLLFIMWGAPRFFPYALMFYPDMLPSPFASTATNTQETKLEKMTRQRSHAVIKTLMDIERSAKEVPQLAKLNIFGRKKQRAVMSNLTQLSAGAWNLLKTDRFSVDNILAEVEPMIYSAAPLTRASMRLTHLPKVVLNGLVDAVEGPNPFGSFLPGFVRRGKLLTHLKRIEDADTFIVDQNVDLDTISLSRLLEACNDRLIASLGRSEAELRVDLKKWIQVAVVEPRERIQQGQNEEHHNGNMARSVLLSIFAIRGMADYRSASFLPREMCAYNHEQHEANIPAIE